MPDNGDRKIIENVTREALSDAIRPEDASGSTRPPIGCVERILNFKDRNNLYGACRAFCAKDGHKGFKDTVKLDRLNKIIKFEETLEYFAMIDDSLEDEILAWQRAKRVYKLWKDYRAGLLTADGFRKEVPNVNLEEGPPKPALLQPETKADDLRGKERSFYLPSKLDVWAQEAIKQMDWSPFVAMYTAELFSKFGINDED